MHSTLSEHAGRPLSLTSPWTVAGLFLIALTGARVAVLFLSDLDLHGDEAQYWTWSLDLDFGYYSKPPMIAWVIRAATELCGQGAACVRLPSPLIHLGTALVLGALARRLYDDRTAVWTAVTFATLPAVSFSSGIISTDVPLLFFWAVALYALTALLAERSAKWAVLLGVAMGLGVMSKYAMVYFLVCAIAYCAVRRDARWLLTSRHAVVALVIAAILFVPNLVWNAQTGWATMGHTADNAHWSGLTLHWDKLGDFLAAQFGVFGPILFAALLLRLVLDRGNWKEADRRLAFFCYPIVALIVIQALLSRAHANWAATAYCAATPLVVAWLVRRGNVWMKGSLALHVVTAAALYLAVLLPATTASALGRDPLAKLRGWDALAADVERRLADEGAAILLFDHRMTYTSLAHKLHGKKIAFYMWNYDDSIDNHFELTRGFDPSAAADRPVVFVRRYDDAKGVAEEFESVRRLAPARRVDEAGGATTYYLFRLDRFRGGGGR